MTRTAIVWFRRDLRLADNAALVAALASADSVVCVALVDDSSGTALAHDAWRERSLGALDRSLRKRGSWLTLRLGPPEVALPRLAEETGATMVTATRDWSPDRLAEERRVRRALGEMRVELDLHEGQLLVTPDGLRSTTGRPYSVFTPFWRRWESAWGSAGPLATPDRIPSPETRPVSDRASDSADHGGVLAGWTPGEAGAAERLVRFVHDSVAAYDSDRDRPDIDGTSRLSPHLAHGEISVRQVADAAIAAHGHEASAPFLRQLAWRDFAYYVHHQFPAMETEPLRHVFSDMPWLDDPDALSAWREGMTGYPLVDAGMRQLRQTGWVHNRVRLVTASFLTKDLLLPWQEGARHFREHLVDADSALNSFNWQWVAGSGADAAPYFRIFNPARQGERFDPDGTYVRAWVPEIAQMPKRWIHKPWEAPESVLADAGIRLGERYPRPIVDHPEARARALAAFASIG